MGAWSLKCGPFALSLSKGCSVFQALQEKGRCFDKLSTNGRKGDADLRLAALDSDDIGLTSSSLRAERSNLQLSDSKSDDWRLLRSSQCRSISWRHVLRLVGIQVSAAL